MGEKAFTILLEGVREVPQWAERICSEFQLVLIGSDEVTEATKRELSPTLDTRQTLKELIRSIGERAPDVEAKYLRQRGIGTMPVI